jgi:membrane fusion protein (multidrug efflux system)
MKRNHWVLLMSVAMIVAVGLTLGGCSKKKPAGPPPMVPEVAVMTVQPKEIVITTELAGRTSAYQIAEVRPQVSGIIQKRLFTEGAEVKAGQPLFQIDPALYQAALDNAKAALARSEAQLPALQVRVSRFKDLLEQKAVSQQDYDDAAAALRQVQADIQFGKASVEAARINLQYTTITAPISGRIGKTNVTEGALVTAHQPLALATIQKIDPMYVDVTQSTADIFRLRQQLEKGQMDQNGKNRQVRLLLDDGTEYPLKGNLQFQDITVDPSTGSVTLRITFPNPKGILLPGMFVRALVQEGINKKAILVPQQAVVRDPRGNFIVLLVDAKGIVQPRPITVDRAIGSDWLVSSGLAPGETVIVEGIIKAKPGTLVKTVPFENGATAPDKMNNAAGPVRQAK